MHCTVKSVDHLGEMLTTLGKGSGLENIKLHRTKCSKLISNVIAPSMLAELLKDIGSSPYAVIVDESTDCSLSKFMAICVRYFSQTCRKMITDFLGMVQVTGCKGQDLANALVDHLKTIGLPLEQLQSIGTDGAANMCGTNNSMFTHLKKLLPHLILIKCICHSLDKCGEYAYKKVPGHLDFILSESFNWFSHSPKRWGEYTEFFKVCSSHV